MPIPEPPRTSGTQPGFADVLAEAVAHRNLTLDRLSQRLRDAGTPVSIATLSYWQTGRSLPTRNRSLKAVAELEKILRVPVGHLTAALPSEAATRWDPITDLPHSEQIEAILRSMGIDPQRHFTTQSVQDSVVVAPTRHHQSETTRKLFVADLDGMDRFPLVFHQDDPTDTPPTVEALVGCELGRVVELEDEGILAAEFRLPHPLARGELAMVQYRITWDTGTEHEPSFSRTLGAGTNFLALDLTFEGQVPRVVNYRTTPRTADGSRSATTLRQPMAAAPYLQLVLADPGPGSHGLEWIY